MKRQAFRRPESTVKEHEEGSNADKLNNLKGYGMMNLKDLFQRHDRINMKEKYRH
jgi:hypothetical protein